MSSSRPIAPFSSGFLYALLAYSAWGLLPIYWKFFLGISPIEVISHRVVWSVLFLGGLIIWQGRQQEFCHLWQFNKLRGLFLTALLLTVNWGIYIHGVNTGRVVETSLGYFINPLVNVLFGYLFLQERLNSWQRVAVGLAALGVGYFVWHLGTVPWIALGLAVTFALYGFLRKIMAIPPLAGLVMETLLIAPLALVMIGYQTVQGTGHWGSSWQLTMLFVGCGFMTSLPLLWFNQAAKRLSLSTLGFFQYLAPTLQLLLGVMVYRESFSPTHLVTFGLIWIALLLYSGSSWWTYSHRSPEE